MTYGAWRSKGGVIYLTTTPKGSAHMSANASVHGRALRAGAFLIACTLALAACKKGDGDAQAKAKEGDKGPEAIPVEVMAASKRAIAASYTGTAPLEARGESQVVAKTSGVALQVLVRGRPAGARRPGAGAPGFLARRAAGRTDRRADAQARSQLRAFGHARRAEAASAPTTSTRSATTSRTRAPPIASRTSNCPTPTSSRRSPA